MSDVDEDALEFFNGLQGELKIELSVPAEPIGPPAVLHASSAAAIVSIELVLGVVEDEIGEPRPLRPDERNRIVIRAPEIALKNADASTGVRVAAPNGEHFTVDGLIAAIAETERRTRSETDWFGGIDVHHIFFEGIFLREDGVWEIPWGS